MIKSWPTSWKQRSVDEVKGKSAKASVAMTNWGDIIGVFVSSSPLSCVEIVHDAQIHRGHLVIMQERQNLQRCQPWEHGSLPPWKAWYVRKITHFCLSLLGILRSRVFLSDIDCKGFIRLWSQKHLDLNPYSDTIWPWVSNHLSLKCSIFI